MTDRLHRWVQCAACGTSVLLWAVRVARCPNCRAEVPHEEAA